MHLLALLGADLLDGLLSLSFNRSGHDNHYFLMLADSDQICAAAYCRWDC